MKSTIVATLALLVAAAVAATLGQPARTMQEQQDAVFAALREIDATVDTTRGPVYTGGLMRATVEGGRYLSTRDVIVRIECGGGVIGYRCNAAIED